MTVSAQPLTEELLQSRVAAHLGRQLQQRSSRLSQSTSPIFELRNDQSLASIGTGLFFRAGSKHFVLSAGHVMRQLRESRLAIGGDGLIPMDGRFFVSPSEDIDLGFFRLNDNQVNSLKGVRFLTPTDIDLEGKPFVRHFYVLGFLAADNAFPPDTTVDALPVCYMLKPAADGKYSRVRLKKSEHWLYQFDRRTLFAPDATQCAEEVPEGLSGAGLWQFRASLDDEKLVALLTEHSEKHKVLIASRLRPLIGALSDYIDGKLI